MSAAQHTPEAFALLREELKTERAVKTELLAALELLLLQCDQHIPKTTASHRALARAAINKAVQS